MNGTVTRLMRLIEAYRTAGGREEHWARKDALEAELTRLFTPLSDEQIAHAWSVGEHNASASTKRRVTRALENLHGIGGGES